MADRRGKDKSSKAQPAPPPSRQSTYFINGQGIDREVITTDICRYLGNDALVKPGTREDPVTGQIQEGFYITAYRAPTTAQLTDLRSDSAKWRAERDQKRGSPGGYPSSSIRQEIWGPEDEGMNTQHPGYTGGYVGNPQPPQNMGGRGFPEPGYMQSGTAPADYRNQPNYPPGAHFQYGNPSPIGEANFNVSRPMEPPRIMPGSNYPQAPGPYTGVSRGDGGYYGPSGVPPAQPPVLGPGNYGPYRGGAGQPYDPNNGRAPQLSPPGPEENIYDEHDDEQMDYNPPPPTGQPRRDNRDRERDRDRESERERDNRGPDPKHRRHEHRR